MAKGADVVRYKKSVQFVSIMATLLMVVLFGFQNCNQIQTQTQRSERALSVAEVQARYNSPDTQIVLKSLGAKEKADTCSFPENYACVVNSFSPENTYDHFFDQHCRGEKCYSVEVWSYDSSTALAKCKDCTEKDGQEGGRYNYDEIYCYNRRLAQITGFEDLHNGDSIGNALDKALDACGKILHK